MSRMMYFFYARGIIGNASSFHDFPLSVLSFNLPTVNMSVSFFVSLANRLHPKNPMYPGHQFWKFLEMIPLVIPNLLFEAYETPNVP